MLIPTVLPRIVAALTVLLLIPTTTALALPLSLEPGDGDNGGISRSHPPGERAGRSSTTIGIAISVIGNILISFALNLQRYSHLRIDREFRQRSSWKKARLHAEQIQHSDYGSCASEETPPTSSLREVTNTPAVEALRREQQAFRPSINVDGALQADRISNGSQSPLSPLTTSSQYTDFEEERRQSYLGSPYWWAGLLLMITGEAGNFLAYGFAPASLVSPLGVVAIISNCLIAPFMLKEKMRFRDFNGVLVAVAGTVVVVLSSNSREQKLGPDKLWSMIANSVFAIYSLVTCTMIAALMWVSETWGPNYILVDVGLVGLFGGYTAMATKGISSLLSFSWWHLVTYPITYLLLAVLVVTALMQIRYINRALQRFDSTQVIPTQFVMFTLSVIVGSAIVYRDFECATWKSGAHFICGCTLTFFGVYLITSGRPKNDDEVKTDADEEALPSYLAVSHASIPNDDSRSLLSHPTVRGEALSPIRSIIDTEDPIDHDDNGSLTPRATSPLQSMSEVSSLLISETTAPSSRLHSRTRVPIEEERPANTAEASPTPAPTSGEILLRFPSAPGMAEEPQRGRSTQRPEVHTEDNAQTVSRPRMPRTGSRAWPRSLPAPTYFAFVPYLAPLSGGITMALADTLSRNDTEANNRRRNSAVPATEYARLRRTSYSRDRGGRPRGRTMGSNRSHVDVEAQVDQNEHRSKERSRIRANKLMGNPSRLHSRMRGYTE